MNMACKIMRLMVYFDLPVKTADDRREYTKFHKYLIRYGFIMVQNSVYSKIAVNSAAVQSIMKSIRENSPPIGNVQILTISERQYQNIEYIVGESQKEVLDSLDRFVIL